jgi:glycerol-3-phosphate dehydrogenase (NAD(P)+)
MKIAVVGGGSWGTAMARLLAMNGHAVTLACRDPEQAEAVNRYHRNPRYLPDVTLPPEIRAAGFDQASLEGVELVAFAVPSAAFAATLGRFVDRLPADAALLSLTKGLDPRDRRRMSEVLATVAPVERIAVLSGPNHAEEVARDFPTASVLASLDTGLACRLQEEIGARRLRIYTSTDVIGVELCAAAKNVIGLAAGVSDGLGFGDNAKAWRRWRGWARASAPGPAPTAVWPAWATWWPPARRAIPGTAGPASSWPKESARSGSSGTSVRSWRGCRHPGRCATWPPTAASSCRSPQPSATSPGAASRPPMPWRP